MKAYFPSLCATCLELPSDVYIPWLLRGRSFFYWFYNQPQFLYRKESLKLSHELLFFSLNYASNLFHHTLKLFNLNITNCCSKLPLTSYMPYGFRTYNLTPPPCLNSSARPCLLPKLLWDQNVAHIFFSIFWGVISNALRKSKLLKVSKYE